MDNYKITPAFFCQHCGNRTDYTLNDHPFVVDLERQIKELNEMYQYKYPMQTVTADTVVVWENQVLFIKRNTEPFKGMYALPGGHLDPEDESTLVTALRELREETGISEFHSIEEIGTFSTKGRDPRGRYITVAYLVRIFCEPQINIDPEEVQSVEWVHVKDIDRDKLAFDHYDIVKAALDEHYILPFETVKEDFNK